MDNFELNDYCTNEKQKNILCNRIIECINMYEAEKIGNSFLVFHEDGVICELITLSLKQLNFKYKVISLSQSLDIIKKIIQTNNICTIISVEKKIPVLNKLLWNCSCLKSYLCIDTNDVYQIETNKSKLMNKKLWEVVSVNAKDEIQGGGWINSYTRKYFTKQEMEEYAENCYIKLKNILNKDKKVFEIGCASGITMFKLAGYVKDYYAIDLSSSNICKDKEIAKKLGLNHIKFFTIPADKILEIGERGFDIVVMNSVTQCFVGLNYLRKVILNSIEIMADNAVLFIGDIMDLDKKDLLYESLIEFKAQNEQYNTKIDLSQELFISKRYFTDISKTIPSIKSVKFSDKIYTIENELTMYRYDVIIEVDKRITDFSYNVELSKYQLGCDVFRPIIY